MDKEFVSYEQALSLKELGFDEECIYVKVIEYGNDSAFYTHTDYNDYPEQRELEIDMPLKQQVFRWFREKYNIHGEVFVNDNGTFIYLISRLVPQGRVQSPIKGMFNTYEKAENACIDKLIEIFKQQDNEN